jgi:hypothetical protein
MDFNTEKFLHEFRSTGSTNVLEEEGKRMEMRMGTFNSVEFALQQKPLNGHTELDYRVMNRSERLTMILAVGGKDIDMELSMPESNSKPVDARGLELPDDFRDQMNVRCRMLVAGSRQQVETVGLTPPLWFVGLPDLQRWLTTEVTCDISVRESVESTITDEPEPGDSYVERQDIGLDLALHIVSATRLAPEQGDGYEVAWRVDAMTAERVYPEPQGGINRIDATGSSQGVARFDESGLLILLSGTGTSRSDMDVNEKYRNPWSESHVGMISLEQEHEISVRRF